MSRRDGIENLLGRPASNAAPTVTEMKKQAVDEPAVPPPTDATSEPSVETSATKSQPDKRRSTNPAAGKERAQIRFQVSPPVGSDVEQALMDALREIPEPLRAGVNIGRLFRTVLIENDEAIALMIRNHVSES